PAGRQYARARTHAPRPVAPTARHRPAPPPAPPRPGQSARAAAARAAAMHSCSCAASTTDANTPLRALVVHAGRLHLGDAFKHAQPLLPLLQSVHIRSPQTQLKHAITIVQALELQLRLAIDDRRHTMHQIQQALGLTEAQPGELALGLHLRANDAPDLRKGLAKLPLDGGLEFSRALPKLVALQRRT